MDIDLKKEKVYPCTGIKLFLDDSYGGKFMYSSYISLSNIEAVKEFVTLANNYKFPINLATDKYKIDAKSIMGIFSLDLSKPLKIEVDADGVDKNKFDDFICQLKPFACKDVSGNVSSVPAANKS